ncbi:Uncharacterized protein TCAP_07360 [Tolypocladium capitatum]|uniref:Uncharacterized protein n=1 Tax=Tolypocladium capitatum TaxID=45235 RepID=A0A2K3PZE3_9HYPO|nr:Uncharacterized protein TCAP_07360 [Tolypocladium capitatum]
MRFAAFIVSGALALVAAQDTLSTAAAPTVSLTPAQAAQAACLKACKSGDVNCQARCVGVPNPDGSQVAATTKCVAACPQGDGSQAQTDQYAACVNKCIGTNYFTSGGTPQPTAGSGSGSGGGSSNTKTGAGGATQTSGGSGATQTGAGSGGSPTTTGGGGGSGGSGSGGSGGSGSSTSTSKGMAPAMTAAPVAVLGLVAAVLAF